MLKNLWVSIKLPKISNSISPKLLLLILLVVLSARLKAQQINLDCENKPLNELLVEMRDQHQLQFSFDDTGLSAYSISVKKNFPSASAALDYLLSDLPFAYEIKKEVFLIYPIKVLPKEKKLYNFAGQFIDLKSGESLPFTHMLLGDHGLLTDHHGNFQYSSEDSVLQLQASHLGYYLMDTVVLSNPNHQLKLKSYNIRLNEVRVEGKEITRNLKVGQTPGSIRLNHNIANYLPGNGDNSIFNLLRLQPGILAAGEQSNDLIIWGSYEGQSQLLFDGFTLFGMKNFNDNISAVNPFMAKDIQVYKGGYGAQYGERVGGLVNITGIDGDNSSPHVNISLNNMTLNGMFSVPIQDKASLAVAFRQTYYELYDTGVLTFGQGRREQGGQLVDNYIYPEYNFRDLNIKYAGKTDGGDRYSFSVLSATDKFSYTIDRELANKTYNDKQKEQNVQIGGSFLYDKRWNDGTHSELLVSYSEIETQVNSFRNLTKQKRQGQNQTETTVLRDLSATNQVQEATVKLNHRMAVGEFNQLKFGGNFIYNKVGQEEDSLGVISYQEELSGSRFSGFVEDELSISKGVKLRLGLRTAFPFAINKLYLQPRVSTDIRLSKHFSFNGAWGKYKQFLVRSSVEDTYGNYRYFWTLSDDELIPVQKSTHTVLGVNFNKNDFTFSVEGFYKELGGISRYIQSKRFQGVYRGEGKSKGLDFFIKKDWKGNSVWASYSLAETLERFSDFLDMDYHRALHDQRHELKLAALFNLKPFFFSANYVYGSGFPDPRNSSLLSSDRLEDQDLEIPYKRFDLALIYQLSSKKKVLIELGVSILNVFNFENVKYENFIRVPNEQEVAINYQAEAVPFTPTMFVNLSF